MKPFRTSLLALAVALAFGVGYRLGGPAGTAVSAQAAPSTGLHAHQHAGMAPAQMSRAPANGAPGKPFDPSDEVCVPGMGAPVRLTSEQQQLIGIRLSTVQRGAAVQPVRMLGKVSSDERRVFVLNSGIDGFIRDVSAATTGSRVRKGEWLASFSSPELRSPLQAYLVSLEVMDRGKAGGTESAAQLKAARTSQQVAVDRLLNLGVSQEQIEEIEHSRIEVPASLKITSPVDGFVLSRQVTPGQKFTKGTEWYRLVNLDKVWLVADVHESDAPQFKPGVQAKVLLNGRPHPVLARVSEVLPQFDSASRTLKVRLEVDNPGHALRPDMVVDLVADVPRGVVTTVPNEALVDSGLQRVVYVDRGSGLFEPRAVVTGARLGQQVEVLSGLKAGDRVVSAGTFLLDSESRMRATPSRPPEPGADSSQTATSADKPQAAQAQVVHAHTPQTPKATR